MRKYSLIFLAAVISLLNACKKSDDPVPSNTGSTYFVISTYNEFDGHISTYSNGAIIDKAFLVSQTPYFDRIADAVISGDKMYAVKSVSTSIDIINLADMKLVKSIPFAKAISGNYFRQIDFSNNKVIVADRAFNSDGTAGDESFLKVINIENNNVDSIPIVKNNPIWALAQVNNKIFVSRQTENRTHSILVLNAANYSVIADINLGNLLCSNFLIDKDNNLLALLTQGKIMLINTNDLSTIKNATIGNVSINTNSDGYVTNNTSYCLDREANVLYFLAVAPQPAPGPYFLRSYDLTSGVTANLSDFIYASTIAFDAKSRLLLLGGFTNTGGEVRIYNTKGIFNTRFDVPTEPSDILMK